MDIVTNTLVHLTALVPDIATVAASYTRLRVHRSTDGGQTYEPMTAAAAAPAFMEAGYVSSNYALEGRRLHVIVNGTIEIDHVFVATDPVSLATAITELGGVTSDVVLSAGTGGAPRLSTDATGTAASIAVQADDDALIYLGITDSGAVGKDADIPLTAAVVYEIEDSNGGEAYLYRTQFINHTTAAMSVLGGIIGPDLNQVVPYADTSVAYLRLTDISGRAIRGRKITLSSTGIPSQVSGVGIFRHIMEATTDATGLASIRVVRGALLELGIDGTTFVRRFTVPDEDAFNLLSSSLVSEDVFGIAEFNVPFAIRTSP